jgi:hypothetical protein
LVRGPYCDDPLRDENLQLQVRIVGHDHELRVSWPLEDRRSPNVMGRSICPIGRASIPGMTLWNGAVDSRNLHRGMPMSQALTRRAH